MRDRRAVAEAHHARGRSTVGWITTSMRSYGTPKRKCASITSRPLLASVAESIVIFGPIDQVGCARASSGVTLASWSAVRPRNGPPLAVRTMLSGSPWSAHWKSAECSLSTGISAPASARAGRERELAGGDEALLVRERERDAVLERPHRRDQPGEAHDRVQDDVGLGRARAARSGLPRSASAAPALRSAASRRSRRRARARDARRSPRSPGARSSRSRRAGRSASRTQRTERLPDLRPWPRSRVRPQRARSRVQRRCPRRRRR